MVTDIYIYMVQKSRPKMAGLLESVDVSWKAKKKIKCTIDASHLVTVSRRKNRFYIKIRKGQRHFFITRNVECAV